MSAVIAETPQLLPAVQVTAFATGADTVLTPACVDLLAELHARHDLARLELLAQRVRQQKIYDEGTLPGFRADTAAIRSGNWRVAPIPEVLLDRRVEITGPTDAKMVINAMNSGANCYMADFEDSTAPTFANLIGGHIALRDAVRGTLEFTAEGTGKHYQLKPRSEQAVLHVRPRGLHLNEKHVLADGKQMSGSLFDAATFLFHNAQELHAQGRGPFLYIPKLQSMEEAAWWNDVLTDIESMLSLPHGCIKVTVLIETFPAAFQMDEILHALQDRIVGLNCGRWDYIFSFIKTLRGHRSKLLPERTQVTMKQPFLRAYSELLIQTCHKRGAFAMGGMAAQIPNSRDPIANEEALSKVRADKVREVTAGHDGTWVAHPGLVPVARQVFDDYMPKANQLHELRSDVLIEANDLLAVPVGTISRRGFANNVEVCVRYLAAWLDGNGCVPIDWLMEDAATAEISRVQLWQWLHTDGLHLHDGTALDFHLFERCLLNLPSVLAAKPDVVGRDKIPAAITMLEKLTYSDELVDFLTLPAYEQL